jgi:glycosyltransferase involved in cell wall biosynthesis
MKILYSCFSRSWGGMEMVTLTTIKKVLKRDIKVEFACIADSRLHIEANNLGIIIHPLNAGGYFHPFTVIRTALLIRRGNYDLIHTHASKDLWLIVPALYWSLSKIPLYLTKHVGSFIIKKDFLHRKLYNRITKIFAISSVIKNNLLNTCPVSEDKILILHNGVDLVQFDPEKTDRNKIRREFEFNDSEIVIGMLARFTIGKGHEEFLWAAKELNKHYHNLKFLIVGEASRGENDYAEGIKKLAKEYNLENVIFAGFRSDIPDVLSAMDIFVFPSHSEAFGIALVEAMAMAKPSVCADANGILDIAVDNETSLLFENKNGEDLFKKISILIESTEKRERFGKAARQRAIRLFDMELSTDRVVEIYRQESDKSQHI